MGSRLLALAFAVSVLGCEYDRHLGDDPDGGPVCADACTDGSARCADGAVQTCTRGAGGCTEWSARVACPTGQSCSGGACVAGCFDQCAIGTTRCSSGGVQACARAASGCTEWGGAVACSQGLVCSGGLCVATCSNQCTAGNRQCSGVGVATCRVMATGCTEWDVAVACPGGQTCSGGQCTAQCSNQCTEGTHQCSGASAMQTCVKLASGCTDWTAAAACPSGQTCSAGQCASVCVEPAWSPRSVVDISDPNASKWLYARAAVDRAGHVHAVYVDGNNYSTQEPNELRYVTDKTGQLVERVIDPAAGTNFDLAVDPDGNAHVAYTSGQAGGATTINQELRYATNKGGTWYTQLVDGNGAEPTYSLTPRLKLDSYGNAHIVYDISNSASAKTRYATNGVYYSNPTLSEGPWSIYTFANSMVDSLEFHVAPDGVLSLAYAVKSYGDVTFASTRSGRLEEEVVYQGRFITYASGDFLYEVRPRCVQAEADGSVTILLDDTIHKQTCGVQFCNFSTTQHDVIQIAGQPGGFTESPVLTNAKARACASDGTNLRLLYSDYNLNLDVPQGSKVATRGTGGWSQSMVSGTALPVAILTPKLGEVHVLCDGGRSGFGPASIVSWSGTTWTTRDIDAPGYYDGEGELALDATGRLHATYEQGVLVKQAVICP